MCLNCVMEKSAAKEACFPSWVENKGHMFSYQNDTQQIKREKLNGRETSFLHSLFLSAHLITSASTHRPSPAVFLAPASGLPLASPPFPALLSFSVSCNLAFYSLSSPFPVPPPPLSVLSNPKCPSKFFILQYPCVHRPWCSVVAFFEGGLAPILETHRGKNYFGPV